MSELPWVVCDCGARYRPGSARVTPRLLADYRRWTSQHQDHRGDAAGVREPRRPYPPADGDAVAAQR